MNIVRVDAIGDNCPIPVVKAKKAIDALTESAIVEISVDNEIAVQNVTKMLNQKNLESTCEKVAENLGNTDAFSTYWEKAFAKSKRYRAKSVCSLFCKL